MVSCRREAVPFSGPSVAPSQRCSTGLSQEILGSSAWSSFGRVTTIRSVLLISSELWARSAMTLELTNSRRCSSCVRSSRTLASSRPAVLPVDAPTALDLLAL